MRDLFILCLLSPIIGMLLRRAPGLGAILTSLAFLTNLDHELVMRTVMPVSFCLGAYVAVRRVDVYALDRYARLCAALLLIMCAAVILMKVENTTPLRLISPFLIWPASSLLIGTRFGAWAASMSKYSFFIFLTHAPVLLLSWKLYQKYGQGIPYPLYWLATPVLTTMLLVGVHRLCVKYIPIPFARARGVRLPRLQMPAASAALNR